MDKRTVCYARGSLPPTLPGNNLLTVSKENFVSSMFWESWLGRPSPRSHDNKLIENFCLQFDGCVIYNLWHAECDFVAS